MTLIEDWRLVLNKASSVKLSLLASGLGIAEAVMPYFSDLFPPHLFGALAALVSLAAVGARLVAQKEL